MWILRYQQSLNHNGQISLELNKSLDNWGVDYIIQVCLYTSNNSAALTGSERTRREKKNINTLFLPGSPLSFPLGVRV